MKLNIEQQKLIQTKPNGHILIKGVAGSGKTTIAVHKIPFLMNNYINEPDDGVLMVSYNKTLVNYISYLYSKVEVDEQISFQLLMNTQKNKIKISTIDSLLYSYFYKYKERVDYKYNVNYDNQLAYNTMIESIVIMKKKYPQINILSQGNVSFIMDEINWIKSCNYMELEEYQDADRLGRMSGSIDGPQRLLKNSDLRMVIFKVMKLYDQKLGERGYIDAKTMNLLALEEANIKVYKKYTHILVDESQDLTRVQLELLKLIYNQKDYSSFCFIADIAQSIYPNAWLVKGRSFSSIGFNMTGKSNSLSKNYRTTTSISEAAYSLLEKDSNIINDENFVKPSLIDRKGEYPVYTSLKTEDEEAKFITNEIKTNLLGEYKTSEIAVIARRHNQLASIGNYLIRLGVKASILDKTTPQFDDESVKLLTMHSIKGLEFKVVFICGLQDGIIPYIAQSDLDDLETYETSERKLLYVGMTRANDKLYLTSNGKPSKFIEQINPKYLRLQYQSKIKTLYPIKIDNYNYTSKIIDLYSNEEKIRQWMINELVETYQYPKSAIDVEYKVQNFSKIGFVDIVVSIYKNNIKEPHIFVETKAYGNGLKQAVEQLKSYMNVNSTCQYGIAVDGCQMLVINKDNEIIPEIPSFNPSMMRSCLESYSYLDLRHSLNYQLVRDHQNHDDIAVSRDGQNEEYEPEELTYLNVYGEIIAGVPKLAEQEIGERFVFPSEWLPIGQDCFLLKVVGDSMEGSNIHYGDYVVVQKQNMAKNMDIVVATVDENATLKKFMFMGDTILLMPDNPNYEPIQMNSQDVIINGIVIGILKIVI